MSENFILITVADEDSGCRLDRYLRTLAPHIKQSEIEKFLRKKLVRVNNGKASSDFRISAGDQISAPNFLLVEFAAENPQRLKETRAPLYDAQADREFLASLVLYENDDFYVFNKPSGLPVQGGSGTQDHIDRALESLRTKKNFRPSLAHRLDKDTSGCLLVAKKRASAVYAGEKFRDRSVNKYYLAVIQGNLSSVSGVLDKPLTKLTGARGFETVRCVSAKEAGALPAYSFYYVISSSETRAFVMLKPLTGRTHQLRVHLSDAGAPIVGDGKYGYREQREKLHLHAWNLEFPLQNPDKEEIIRVKAPFPDHIKATLERERMTFHSNELASAKEMLDIVAERETGRLILPSLQNHEKKPSKSGKRA